MTWPHLSQIAKAVMRVAVVVRFGAGDEGVEAFQPVHEAGLHQRVERPVDLQRRAKAVLAQLVEQRVGAERPARRLEPFQHAQLVPGEHVPPGHGDVPVLRPFPTCFACPAADVSARPIDSASADGLLIRLAHEDHVAAFMAGALDRPVLRFLVGIADHQRDGRQPS